MSLLGLWDVGCAPSGGAWVQVGRGRKHGLARQGRAAPGTVGAPSRTRRRARPRPGETAGPSLTEARARRECALAYRALVDAVYAEAGLGAGAAGPGDNRAAVTGSVRGT